MPPIPKFGESNSYRTDVANTKNGSTVDMLRLYCSTELKFDKSACVRAGSSNRELQKRGPGLGLKPPLDRSALDVIAASTWQIGSGTAILCSDNNHTHFCIFTSSSSPSMWYGLAVPAL